MSQLKQELGQLQQGLETLSKFQTQIDDATWLIEEPKMAKVRHINLHIVRLCGKLADMVHKWEHDVAEGKSIKTPTEHIDPEIMQRIIADFIIHATQLNNVIGTDLFEVYKNQIQRNLERYAPESELNLLLQK